MHHKRKRPKNRRSGCLMCKAHKQNNLSWERKSSISDKRRLAKVDEPKEKPGFPGSSE